MADDPQQGGPTLEQIAEGYINLVAHLGPAGTTQEQAMEALNLAQEMEQRPDWLQANDAFLSPERATKRPGFGVRLHHRKLEPIFIKGTKRVGPATPTDDLLGFGLIVGLLTSPILRAVLIEHGYRAEFVEIAQKSPIITKL